MTSAVTFLGTPADARVAADEALVRVMAAVPRTTAVPGTPSEVRLEGGGRMALTCAAPEPADAYPPRAFQLIAIIVDRAQTAPSVLRAALAAVRAVALTPTELGALDEQMPLLAEVRGQLPANALRGAAPVLVNHHTLDFVAFVETLVALGVDPRHVTVLTKQYRYRHRERVDAHLRRLGIRVRPTSEAADALTEHAARASLAGCLVLLLGDNGGYLLPSLLSTRPDLARAFSGAVEMTRAGIRRLEPFDGGIPMPVLSLPDWRGKPAIEPYGIAGASTRSILDLLPNEQWAGQPAAVLGFGELGRTTADVLRALPLSMRVAVFDTDIASLTAASTRGFVTNQDVVALLQSHRPRLIIGATGETALTVGDLLAAIPEGGHVWLASVTSRQHEFPLDDLAALAERVEDLGRLGTRYHLPDGRVVTLLGHGCPINFHWSESLPNATADVLLAALVFGLLELKSPTHAHVDGVNVTRTNRILDGRRLLEQYYSNYVADQARAR